MSDSSENSIGRRLKGHLTGQSGNNGIKNYAQERGLSFTYYSLDVLRKIGTDNLFELESIFLEDFMQQYGCYPICNGQAGHTITKKAVALGSVDIDWSFFY